MDFAGIVLSEDGVHSLRPDQLIPVLWQAMKEMSAEVDKLKTDLKAAKTAPKK